VLLTERSQVAEQPIFAKHADDGSRAHQAKQVPHELIRPRPATAPEKTSCLTASPLTLQGMTLSAWVSSVLLKTQAARFTSATAADFGRLGGSVTTPRKASAARKNGRKGGRPRKIGKAHQHIIRERAALLEPREPLPNLDGCTVHAISTASARPLILRYEWLGTLGRPRACYGLHAADGGLLGVVTFGAPAGDRARNICGPEHRDEAITLERGACVHFAPKNAASFLIRHAVKLAHCEYGWSIFTAYADESAGEIGTVYQAANWYYVGKNVGRHPSTPRRRFIKPNGQVVDERALHRNGVKTRDVLGWLRVVVPSKHRYVWFEGPDANMLKAKCRYPFKAYPKRRQT
jgi:hypothetical protein